MKIAGFNITKIVIIQSLEEHEAKTGKHLGEYISAQLSACNSNLGIELVDCSNFLEFQEILERLNEESARGEIPLLHVECHGSAEEGLEFGNGSTLGWSDLALALTRLNTSCRLNLFAVFSACFGGHFLREIHAVHPAPCFCLVAPTHSVDPGEIMQGFRLFYSTLFRERDVGKALQSLKQVRLAEGKWFAQPVELWFQKIVAGYLEKHCTKKAVRDRAKRMYRVLRKDRIHKSIGSLKRVLRDENRKVILGSYFERFFLIDKLPENRQRFRNAFVRLERRYWELRASRKYVL